MRRQTREIETGQSLGKAGEPGRGAEAPPEAWPGLARQQIPSFHGAYENKIKSKETGEGRRSPKGPAEVAGGRR